MILLTGQCKCRHIVQYEDDAVLAEIEVHGKIVRKYGKLFAAVSVSMSDSKVASLKQVKGIKKIWPVVSISTYSRNSNIQRKIKKMQVSLAPVPSIRDQILLSREVHRMTGVNRFHRKFPNFDGRGIKVGIIDTGIDYTHEALGGCFGSTCRVAFGSDFADEDLDPMDWYVHPLKEML